MTDKVYFAESKPVMYERNTRFKLKSNFEADIQYKETDLFALKICDQISQVIEEHIEKSVGQNLSNKEKTALLNLIKAKNIDILFNDTDKNTLWGCRQRECYIRINNII